MTIMAVIPITKILKDICGKEDVDIRELYFRSENCSDKERELVIEYEQPYTKKYVVTRADIEKLQKELSRLPGVGGNIDGYAVWWSDVRDAIDSWFKGICNRY